MCKAVLVSLFWFTIATTAAPTLLEANTLLQNGEEAQALNRYFKSLKTDDHCNGMLSTSLPLIYLWAQ